MAFPIPRRSLWTLCLVALLYQLPLAAAEPASLAGTWHGELNLVVQKLRIGFKIESTPEGTLKGVMDSIEKSAFGIPLLLPRQTESDPVRLPQRRRLRRWQLRAADRESTVE